MPSILHNNSYVIGLEYHWPLVEKQDIHKNNGQSYQVKEAKQC